MYHVYVLYSSKTKKHYIGCTNNLERRLQEHDNNQTHSLKNRGPFKLLYKETFSNLKDARKRERQIKSYKGGEAFKKLINRF